MSIYAISDLHGRYDIWEKVKEFLNEDDTLYILGDILDRGDGGCRIFIEALQMPNVIILKGNHEECFVDYFLGELGQYDIDIWLEINGGDVTLEEYRKLSKKEKKIFNYKVVDDLPTAMLYTNKKKQEIFLSHAGFTFRGFNAIPPTSHLLWSRKHFYDIWNIDDYADIYCVHGHTPVLYSPLDKYMEGKSRSFPSVSFYAGGHKICLDMCLASEWAEYTALLNLDNFKTTYIGKEGVIEIE